MLPGTVWYRVFCEIKFIYRFLLGKYTICIDKINSWLEVLILHN
nr:MAG TPA: hypothetical protein [Caudoviricetes sp.]DAW29291.1 MAG TPA: hypothetical protein [Caudoviricetes sp.]